MYISSKQAQAILTDHGIENSFEDGILSALSIWTQKNKNGQIIHGEEWVELPLIDNKILEWLGY